MLHLSRPNEQDHSQMSMKRKVERYLRTGHFDDLKLPARWDGYFERAKAERTVLRQALIDAVRQRSRHAIVHKALKNLDVVSFTRAKISPMVRALFVKDEQAIVIDQLSQSVVFMTPNTIDTVLRDVPWNSTAWKLANLFLESIGADLLGDEAPCLLGISEETTCYVSARYFDSDDKFEDVVVHEAAHVFHNCKRETIGLRKMRGREWLLDIDYFKRETFAYCCEAYSRIIELGEKPSHRRMLVSEIEGAKRPPDDRVDGDEYVDILREAVAARSGWKCILERCRSPRQTRFRAGDACPVIV